MQETLFVGMGPQRALLEEGTPRGGGGDKYVALASGLCAGDEAGEPQHVALLVDWLAGLLGSAPEQAQVAQVRAGAHHLASLPGPVHGQQHEFQQCDGILRQYVSHSL